MVQLSAYSYTLACTKRGTALFPSGFREGMFVKMTDDNGRSGIGEFAPFLHANAHTISDVLSMAQKVTSTQLREVWSTKSMTLSSRIEFFQELAYPLSNVLSGALYHATDQDFVANVTRRAVKLAALIDNHDKNEAVTLAQSYCAQGYSCLKIKIGGLRVEDEIDKIKLIASIVGNQVQLRLDANRRFSLYDACVLLNGLRRVNIEYIEEPLVDVNQTKTLFANCGVPIAIDESFCAPYDVSLLKELSIAFLIIKPERFHSVYELQHVVNQAKLCGVIPIFSHCFESELTSLKSMHLVDKLELLDQAHGILPEGFFKHGLFLTPLRSFRGQLFIEGSQVDEAFLEDARAVTRKF